VTVLGILVGFEAFTAGVAETKVFWLVSTVFFGGWGGGADCRLPLTD
jgi:hypothetical protein